MESIATSPPLLELKAVGISRRDDPQHMRLEKVDLTLRFGDFLVVGGRPGSGKSDLLMTAAGLQQPAKGEVHLFGVSIENTDELESNRSKIGVLFENGSRLFHHMTVGENLMLPLRYHLNLSSAEAREMVQPWVERFELEHHIHKHPGTLPRTWKGRVALARALVLKPVVLLLDDPLSGLDLKQIRWWVQELQDLASGREPLIPHPMSILVGTDNMRPWKDVPCDIAVLSDKQLMFIRDKKTDTKPSQLIYRELLGEEI